MTAFLLKTNGAIELGKRDGVFAPRAFVNLETPALARNNPFKMHRFPASVANLPGETFWSLFV